MFVMDVGALVSEIVEGTALLFVVGGAGTEGVGVAEVGEGALEPP